MFRRLLLPTLAASLVLAACAESPFGSTTTATEDYALVMFGEYGSALEGTMGPETGPRPFDGRSIRPVFPDSIALSDEQRAAMLELRIAFRAEHEEELDALRDIFQQARLARLEGATREEVRAILATGRPIAEALRPDVVALHEALRALLTDEQRAWLAAHRPPRRFGPRP
jgi:Spy/CpxP family protein refolding chaperone